jgi:hypothetical protein
MIAMVCGAPSAGRARWSVWLIAQEAVKRKLVEHAGPETVRVLLQSHDLKPRREKMWCMANLDEEYIRRMEARKANRRSFSRLDRGRNIIIPIRRKVSWTGEHS